MMSACWTPDLLLDADGRERLIARFGQEAAAAVGLVAFAVVVMSVGWRVVRHGTVMAHEGAHAVLGSLLFRKVSGIELHRDATGGRA